MIIAAYAIAIGLLAYGGTQLINLVEVDGFFEAGKRLALSWIALLGFIYIAVRL